MQNKIKMKKCVICNHTPPNVQFDKNEEICRVCYWKGCGNPVLEAKIKTMRKLQRL